MKICIKCDIEKRLSEFSNNKTSKDGHINTCKDCDNKRRKELSRLNKKNYIPNPLNLTSKICVTCRIDIPIGDFSYCKLFKDGFQSSCKKCRAELARIERVKNQQRIKEQIFEKKCSYCKLTKPIIEFTNAPSSKDGYQHFCKTCQTAKKFKIKFEPIDYTRMLEEQDYKCKICKLQFSFIDSKRMTTPCIDHCHVTNKIRGLLCMNCNTGLGMFKDNINFMYNAINYLLDNHSET
jgi:hypothetical protein